MILAWARPDPLPRAPGTNLRCYFFLFCFQFMF